MSDITLQAPTDIRIEPISNGKPFRPDPDARLAADRLQLEATIKALASREKKIAELVHEAFLDGLDIKYLRDSVKNLELQTIARQKAIAKAEAAK
jgi:hypothetical protein